MIPPRKKFLWILAAVVVLFVALEIYADFQHIIHPR